MTDMKRLVSAVDNLLSILLLKSFDHIFMMALRFFIAYVIPFSSLLSEMSVSFISSMDRHIMMLHAISVLLCLS